MAAVTDRYLAALSNKDWKELAATLSEADFERVGPYCDVITTKDAYVAFLDRVVSPLEGYSVVKRRSVCSDGTEFAEVVESFLFNETEMEFPEVLVFDMAGDGLLRRVQVYMMRPGEEPPVPGAKA